MHLYFVYILASKRDGVLYIGVTNDLSRRIDEHKKGAAESFTQKYYVDRLVYVEEFQYIEHALAREKVLKRWKRDWKIELIEKINPEWNDLYETINQFV